MRSKDLSSGLVTTGQGSLDAALVGIFSGQD